MEKEDNKRNNITKRQSQSQSQSLLSQQQHQQLKLKQESDTKHIKQRPPQILLGITGSVASIKGPELALSLAQSLHANVIVVLTKGGTNFWYKAKDYNELKWMEYCSFVGCHGKLDCDDDKINEKSVFSVLHESKMNENGNYSTYDNTESFQGGIGICHAQDEWNEWNKIGDPVLHIQLRDWADIMIMAPLSAHTLAKTSNGLCDDTLSCILRAWDYGHRSTSTLKNDDTSCTNKKVTRKRKPIIVAPAMNTAMWEHPLTKQQLEIMKGFWSKSDYCAGNDTDGNLHESWCQTYIVEPQVKTLACGDVGTGAMANVLDIINVAKHCLDEQL